MTYKIMHQTRGDEDDVDFYYLQKNDMACELSDRRYFRYFDEVCFYTHLHFDNIEIINSVLIFEGSTIVEICSFETLDEFREKFAEYFI